MMQLGKFVLMAAACVVGLAVLGISVMILWFFPSWVRWTAVAIVALMLGWFVFFGRFRRKAGLLINDGAVYDRWRKPSKGRKEFL